MSTLSRRNGQVQLQVGTALNVGAGYKVTAYGVGAQASADSSGTTITVQPGHGAVAGDKILISPGASQVYSGLDTVQSVTATTIVMGSTYAVSAGDVIFVLGSDTGVATPEYDASPVAIYDDMAGAGTAITNSEVTTASDGQYGYWSRATGAWELIRTAAGTVADYVMGAMGGEVNPCDYGAAGDGAADDTLRLQSAMLAASSGSVLFPAGTFLVSPQGSNPKTCVKLYGGTKIIGAGMGKTTIKVKDSAGSYAYLLASAIAATTDVSGLTVTDITFDHNIANNGLPVGGAYSLANDLNASVYVAKGSNVHIERCEVKNSSPVNALYLNGGSAANLADCWVRDCFFTAIGGDPNTITHDSSTIYFHGDGFTCTGNVLATTLLDVGTRCAIEFHGRNIRIEGNRIKNFRDGINVTGIYEADSTGIVIRGNTIKNVKQGIVLFSQTYSTHTATYGIDGCIIEGNTIDLAGTNALSGGNTFWAVSTGYPEGGIFWYSGITLPSRNVRIANNVITHPLEGASYTNANDSMGIGEYAQSYTAATLSDSAVENNSITNFPMCGIRFSCPLTNVRVQGNTLRSCGSTQSSPTEAYRDPITVIGGTISGLEITANNILNDETTTGFLFCINLLGTPTGTGVIVRDNNYQVTGTKNANFKYINPGSTAILPYVREAINGVASYFTEYTGPRLAYGSQYTDTGTGIVYTLLANRYTWVNDFNRTLTLDGAVVVLDGNVVRL